MALKLVITKYGNIYTSDICLWQNIWRLWGLQRRFLETLDEDQNMLMICCQRRIEFVNGGTVGGCQTCWEHCENNLQTWNLILSKENLILTKAYIQSFQNYCCVRFGWGNNLKTWNMIWSKTRIKFCQNWNEKKF